MNALVTNYFHIAQLVTDMINCVNFLAEEEHKLDLEAAAKEGVKRKPTGASKL